MMKAASKNKKSSYTPRRAAVLVLKNVASQLPYRMGGTMRGAESTPFKLETFIAGCRPEQRGAAPWLPNDEALFYALSVGSVRHWLRLNAYITHLSECDWKRLDPTVAACLRVGLFQLLEMDDIPDYAAVNATMDVAEGLGVSKKSRGFINGVLRSAARLEGKSPFPSLVEDALKYLTTEASLPDWFANRLLQRHSLPDIEGLLEAYRTPTPLTIRVNTLKISLDEALQLLKMNAIAYGQNYLHLPELLTLKDFRGLPTQLPGYNEGLFYAQEPSSSQVAYFLNPQPSDIVLDLCAAPGSKTSHMAALMKNSGTIVAIEPKPKRFESLKSNMERLGANCVTSLCLRGEALFGDAGQQFKELQPYLSTGFDKVLVDAPCSGLGTLRKNPELLLTLSASRVVQQAALQISLLKTGLKLLKAGGTLVYSTCSNEAEETDAVVSVVLKEFEDCYVQERLERLPSARLGSVGDGFTQFRIVKTSTF